MCLAAIEMGDFQTEESQKRLSCGLMFLDILKYSIYGNGYEIIEFLVS